MLAALVAGAPARAADAPPDRPEPPRLVAARVAQGPVIDGRLDDEVWQLATPSAEFTQKFPDEGQPPSEATLVRVLYDDQAVYIGVACEQQRAPLRSRLTRRDREAEGEGRTINPGTTDRITVHIASRRDGATAYQFGINAAGVLSDGVHFDDVAFSARWDENWEGRTALTPEGWAAELRIPLRALRFDDEPVQSWGFNVRRYIAARQEIDEWAFTPRAQAGVVSRFGELTRLENLRAPARVELRPFIVARSAHRSHPPVTTDPWRNDWSAGLDGKWQPTSNLTLSATLNPDFGQVEADQVVLNLTTYEVFLPEKRPFFLEGLELFETPKPVLYTRRLGGAPAAPALPTGERRGDPPEPSAILGALKLTGQPVRGLSVGVLSAVTERNLVRVMNDAGTTSERLAAVPSVASALRLKLDTGSNAHVGFLGTGLQRLDAGAALPAQAAAPGEFPLLLCPSGTRVLRAASCEHDAYVGGLDGRWRSADGGYYLSWQGLTSKIVGGQPRTMPDGSVIRPGAQDYAGILRGGKEGGTFLAQGGLNYTGRHFDYNDLGFQRQQNDMWAFFELGVQTLRPWGFTKETRSGVWGRELTNVQRFGMTRELGLWSTVLLPSLWRVQGELRYVPRQFSDREIRGARAILELEPFSRYDLTVRSPQSLPLIGALHGELRRTGPGGYEELSGQLFVRALPSVELDLLYALTHTHGERRYLSRQDTGAGTSYLFARLEALGDSTTVRATYSISPTLTLQAYAQLFRAFRRYHDYARHDSALAAPVIRRAQLIPTEAPETRPDASDAALNATVVLRWEYSLGSTLFAVYGRQQVPTATLVTGETPRLDLGALGRATATDAFMLKLAHWWG